MLVVRGSPSDVDTDGAVTRRLAGLVEERRVPALRVWTPPRQVAFGRRDAAADGYDRARVAALERGYDPVERRVGGRAVAYTGETVALAHVTPVDGERDGIRSRYREATARLERAVRTLDATLWRGEPDGSFCPGEHSLQADGKVAGVAQRVRRESALVGACVVAVERDEAALASVLEPVYDALGVPFDPDSVGSVEGAGGPDDVAAVVDAVEAAFVGDREPELLAASELLDS